MANVNYIGMYVMGALVIGLALVNGAAMYVWFALRVLISSQEEARALSNETISLLTRILFVEIMTPSRLPKPSLNMIRSKGSDRLINRITSSDRYAGLVSIANHVRDLPGNFVALTVCGGGRGE